jgi:hypothetical protein
MVESILKKKMGIEKEVHPVFTYFSLVHLPTAQQ